MMNCNFVDSPVFLWLCFCKHCFVHVIQKDRSRVSSEKPSCEKEFFMSMLIWFDSGLQDYDMDYVWYLEHYLLFQYLLKLLREWTWTICMTLQWWYFLAHCEKIWGGAVPVRWHSEAVRSAISDVLIIITAFIIASQNISRIGSGVGWSGPFPDNSLNTTPKFTFRYAQELK